MTTGTVCGESRAVLRGQPMITLEEGFYTVGRQVVLGVQPLGGVTIAAHISRDLQGRTALQADDFVLRMTIGTGWRIAVAGRDRLAMHTLLHVFCGLSVTTTASLSQLREVQR